MSLLYTLIGGGIFLAIIILGAMKYGQKKTENKVAEANVESAKKSVQTAEAILNRKPGDGIANLKRLSQRKRP